MKIVLKDNQLSKEQEQHTEELVNKYDDKDDRRKFVEIY